MSAAERAAFTAPADSALTVTQVDRYLRTTLAQLELLRQEGEPMRETLAAREREPKPPAAPSSPGPRRRTRQALWGDFVDATFVRSARKLGYNPAELLYVRGRIAVVGGHLLAAEMHATRDQAAALFRQQAETMRGIPGSDPAQIEAMLKAAARAETQGAAPTHPRVAQNLAVLRQAHGTIGDAAWGNIAGVAAGAGLTELGTLPQADADRKLDELRRLHQGALEGRSPPG